MNIAKHGKGDQQNRQDGVNNRLSNSFAFMVIILMSGLHENVISTAKLQKSIIHDKLSLFLAVFGRNVRHFGTHFMEMYYLCSLK